jgi:hypothetical protein
VVEPRRGVLFPITTKKTLLEEDVAFDLLLAEWKLIKIIINSNIYVYDANWAYHPSPWFTKRNGPIPSDHSSFGLCG